MRNYLIILVTLTLLSSCNRDSLNNSDQLAEDITPSLLSVQLNTEPGYVVNALTGDSIKPLINTIGNFISTGVPLKISGDIITLGTERHPEIIRSGEPKVIKANPNVHRVPDDIKEIVVDKEKLKTFNSSTDTSSFILFNSKGTIVPTGVAMPLKGRIVPCLQPKPVKGLPPAIKDIANINIRYMDIEHGLNSSYILSIMEDSRGNIWFGTNGGGVSKYNGDLFTHYSRKEGLGGDIVWSMFEDHLGNIWFGTRDGGISMYNGDYFTQYSETNGLNSDFVISIFEDSQNNLWFGTSNCGVSKFDGETFTYFTKKEGLSNNSIRSITEDSEGNLWFGTDGGGICIFDGQTFTYLTEKEGLSNNSIFPMLIDSRGNKWFGTWGGGVSMYNGKSFTNYTTKEGLVYNYINSIIEDKKGNIWFGTWEGVSKFDGISFTNYTEKEGLSYKDVYSMLEDSYGDIWFGTWGGGVSFYSGSDIRNFTMQDGLIEDHVFSVMEDRKNNLWFGSWGGVSKYDGKTFSNFTLDEGMPHNYIYSMLEDRQGNVWFGTQGGGVGKYDGKYFTNFSDRTGLANNLINAMSEDRNGNIWIGTNGGGISVYNGKEFTNYNEKNGLPNNIINSIIEDAPGNVWIASEGGGVSKFDGQTFTHYSEKEGLSSNKISSIMEDSHGNLWLGTNGEGICLFNEVSFTYITDKDGLSNNIIRSITEDNNQNIWIGTEKGLNLIVDNTFSDFINNSLYDTSQTGVDTSTISPNRPKIHSFSKQDGLKGTNFYQNSALCDNKNNIWWGNEKSLAMLDRNNLKIPLTPPALQLNRIEINENFYDFRHIPDTLKQKILFDSVAKFYNYPINLQLPYTNNHLTFYFSARERPSQYKIKYRYKIEGKNSYWSLPSTEGKAEFRNLPYGTNTFMIQVIGESQNWSEPFEYQFYINPPWWFTTWFIIIIIILVFSSGWGIILMRTSVLRKRKIELEAEVAKRTAQLESAIKELESFSYSVSHDLRAPLRGINGFTQILSDEYNDKLDDEGKRICSLIQYNSHKMGMLIDDLLSFSRLGRAAMQNSVINMRKMADSVYFDITDQETRDRTDFTVKDIPNAYGDVALIKQVWINLISNAIKFSSKKEKAIISVSCKIEGQKLIYCIKDNGVGFDNRYKDKLFGVFQRLHSQDEFDGTGVGLAIVQRIILRHSGEVWADGDLEEGASFYFSLPSK